MITADNKADCPAYITHGRQMFGGKGGYAFNHKHKSDLNTIQKNFGTAFSIWRFRAGHFDCFNICRSTLYCLKGHDITDKFISTVSAFNIFFPQDIRNRDGSGIGENTKFFITENQAVSDFDRGKIYNFIHTVSVISFLNQFFIKTYLFLCLNKLFGGIKNCKQFICVYSGTVCACIGKQMVLAVNKNTLRRLCIR